MLLKYLFKKITRLFCFRFNNALFVSVNEFRNYLNNEHRDKRLNEVLYPPSSEENVRRIVETCVSQSPYKISPVGDVNKQIQQGFNIFIH